MVVMWVCKPETELGSSSRAYACVLLLQEHVVGLVGECSVMSGRRDWKNRPSCNASEIRTEYRQQTAPWSCYLLHTVWRKEALCRGVDPETPVSLHVALLYLTTLQYVEPSCPKWRPVADELQGIWKDGVGA